MKLVHMRARINAAHAELELEFDGVHYEAERIQIGTDAQDVARRLCALAKRIVELDFIEQRNAGVPAAPACPHCGTYNPSNHGKVFDGAASCPAGVALPLREQQR